MYSTAESAPKSANTMPLSALGQKTLHSCNCVMAVGAARRGREDAITEIPDVWVRKRGVTPEGTSFAGGVLDVGEPMAVRVTAD